MLARIRQGVSALGQGAAARSRAGSPRSRRAWTKSGCSTGLAADSAGAQLLDLMGRLGDELAGGTLAVDFSEWRRWLARQLEAATFRDRAIESPVVFTSLAATRLRSFDAVLILGGDAAHLPGPDPASMFFSQGVRAELKLPTWSERVSEMVEELAALIASCGEVADHLAAHDRRRGQSALADLRAAVRAAPARLPGRPRGPRARGAARARRGAASWRESWRWKRTRAPAPCSGIAPAAPDLGERLQLSRRLPVPVLRGLRAGTEGARRGGGGAPEDGTTAASCTTCWRSSTARIPPRPRWSPPRRSASSKRLSDAGLRPHRRPQLLRPGLARPLEGPHSRPISRGSARAKPQAGRGAGPRSIAASRSRRPGAPPSPSTAASTASTCRKETSHPSPITHHALTR